MKIRKHFTITEKAPPRTLSLLKVPTSAFTFKNLLRHYAKQEFNYGMQMAQRSQWWDFCPDKTDCLSLFSFTEKHSDFKLNYRVYAPGYHSVLIDSTMQQGEGPSSSPWLWNFAKVRLQLYDQVTTSRSNPRLAAAQPSPVRLATPRPTEHGSLCWPPCKDLCVPPLWPSPPHH